MDATEFRVFYGGVRHPSNAVRWNRKARLPIPAVVGRPWRGNFWLDEYNPTFNKQGENKLVYLHDKRQ